MPAVFVGFLGCFEWTSLVDFFCSRHVGVQGALMSFQIGVNLKCYWHWKLLRNNLLSNGGGSCLYGCGDIAPILAIYFWCCLGICTMRNAILKTKNENGDPTY